MAYPQDYKSNKKLEDKARICEASSKQVGRRAVWKLWPHSSDLRLQPLFKKPG